MSQTLKSLTEFPPVELLAPARNREVAIEAIKHGADAVYMGATSHGARAAAGNSIADIAAVAEFAHQFDARVYVTVNTLVYPDEIAAVERLITDLWHAGADALIVQDLGVLRMNIPPIALHASTQCDIRTPQTARFLQEIGFSQLVLPRELSVEEIEAMRTAVSVPLEAFVHGALCVSYSGDCYASQLTTERSANRGECAQLCRLPYDLTDADGRVLVRQKHLLSLRDLFRLPDLERLIRAGVTSLKIEGRLKDADYVKNVVSAYDLELRRLGCQRTSRGNVERTFNPDVQRSFNRGFTSYFFTTPAPTTGMASIHSPKSLGVEIGTVKDVRGTRVTLRSAASLANGDGLTTGSGLGFRVNRVDSATSFTTAEPVSGLRAGDRLYRNYDKRFADSLEGDTATRRLPVHLTLRRAAGMLCLEADGVTATVDAPEVQQARTPQTESRRRVLAKLGATPYELTELTDMLGDEFVAASTLTELRRRLTDLLAEAQRARRPLDLRRSENPDARAPWTSVDYHANVANPLAEQVLRDHGVTGAIEPALEVSAPPRGSERCVMTTRYCLRRELGHCLRTPQGREWPADLRLRARGINLRVHCDCARCQMQLFTTT